MLAELSVKALFAGEATRVKPDPLTVLRKTRYPARSASVLSAQSRATEAFPAVAFRPVGVAGGVVSAGVAETSGEIRDALPAASMAATV